MSRNSLTFSCRFRYYIRHPIRFFREIKDNIENTHKRITRGWAYSDVWGMEEWFYDVIPDMLDYLADHSHGYPGNEEFPTYESWAKYLRNIANDLRLCSEESADKMNEYYDEMINTSYKSEKYKELSKKFYERYNEIYNEQEAIREEALARLAHILPTLWD